MTPAETQESGREAYQYAVNLARNIFREHYASDPHYASGEVVWRVCDDLLGVLTQIDNMVSGLVRKPAAALGSRP